MQSIYFHNSCIACCAAAVKCLSTRHHITDFIFSSPFVHLELLKKKKCTSTSVLMDVTSIALVI